MKRKNDLLIVLLRSTSRSPWSPWWRLERMDPVPLANWRITWKIVVDDWDRATRRPDCPWDNSPSYCASSTPNPRISPPGSISERTLCPRRFHPLSSFVDLVDSRTLGASYPRCEPSGTISTWNRAALKIPAKNRIAGAVGNVALPRIIYRLLRTVIPKRNIAPSFLAC